LSIAVAVISSDMEYVTRMMSYMKGSPIYHTWRLQLYSTPERIGHLAELERADLIVVEEALYSLLVRRIEAGGGVVSDHVLAGSRGAIPFIVLTAERREQEQYELYKFQSLSALLHSMQQRYEYFRSDKAKSYSVTGDKPRVIGVCSTLEQTGKTVLALHIAALLVSKGYRVFYYNLEHWNTSEYYLQGLLPQETASYSDLLYLVKSKQSIKRWLADSVQAVARYGFNTLRPFQHEADRSSLASDDVKAILSAIVESGLYDFVIVDFPAGLNSWTLPLLQQCTAHYMLELPQLTWQHKHQLALASAERQAGEIMQELQHKSWSIINELNSSGGAGIEGSHMALASLPYVAGWQEREPILLGTASYRAAVERCISPLLFNTEKVGGLNAV
jgi:hypothetical protein